MIRALRYLVAILWSTIWIGTRIVIASLAGVRQTPGGFYDRMQFRYGASLLKSSGIAVEVEGLDRLLPGQPVVFIANHVSWVDIWMLLVSLPGTTRFVFKRELARIPILGRAAIAMGHVPLDRTDRGSAFASYDRAADKIREGTSAIVFAEGTRSPDGRLLAFKKGPFVLAIAAQAPVVPVVCEGSFERLPKGSISPRPGVVTVRIGTPIPTTGLRYEGRDGLADRTRAAMLAMGAPE